MPGDEELAMMSRVQVDLLEYEQLLAERRTLRRQVDELQARGTEMALARQRVSALIDKYEHGDGFFCELAAEFREANRDA